MVLVALVCSALSPPRLGAEPATAVHPFDAEQRALTQRVLRQRDFAPQQLSLWQLWQLSPWATPASTERALVTIGGARRVHPASRNLAKALQAESLWRRGRVAEAQALQAKLGYLHDWVVVGPFANAGKAGFVATLPPEKAPGAAPDWGARFAGQGGTVRWRDWPGVHPLAYVDLSARLRPAQQVCAFATTAVALSRPAQLTLWLGNAGAAILWFNGKRVLHDTQHRGAARDRYVASVQAPAGRSRILLKLCNGAGPLGFYLRVGDRRGAAATGVQVQRDARPRPAQSAVAGPAISAASAPARRRRASRTVALVSPLTRLRQAVQARPTDAAALERLAHFVSLTDADDRDDPKAPQWAERAAQVVPTPARLHLAQRLARQRADEAPWVVLAQTRFAASAQARWLVAEHRSRGPGRRRALQALQAFTAADGRWAVHAWLRQAELYQGLALPVQALGAAERAWQRAPSAQTATAVAQAATAAGFHDRAQAAWGEVLTRRQDGWGAWQEVIEDALRRGDKARLNHVLQALRALRPDDPQQWRRIADVHAALGAPKQALTALGHAQTLAPADADVALHKARLWLRLGQDSAAKAALEAALGLEPQLQGAQALLHDLRPQRAPEQRFFVTPARLQRRWQAWRRTRQRTPSDTVTLQDLRVVRVHPSGVATRVFQRAFAIVRPQGADRRRYWPIAYTPGRESLRIERARVYRRGITRDAQVLAQEQDLSEPWSRLYYDRRARIIHMPKLHKGDVVELRYRIDALQTHNHFADQFSDVQVLQDEAPALRRDLIWLRPAKLAWHLHQSRPAQLQHRRGRKDGLVFDHISVTHQPGLSAEAQMPGPTSLAPYVHISTFRDWQAVGRWYWGLVHSQ
ncbi:MAG: DUF3857 domain-containing protein, partial [Polyangiales bacterium]